MFIHLTAGTILQQQAGTPTPPSGPSFSEFALNFADEGGVASKTVTISGTSGNLWLGFVCCVHDRTILDPSGWTLLLDTAHTGSAAFHVKWWWRILSGATSNPAFTLNMGSDEWCAGVIEVTGANATAPIGGIVFTNDTETKSPVSPSRDTSGPNRLNFSIYHANRVPATADAGYPAGTTGLFARSPLGTEASQSTGVAYLAQAAAGASGAKTWTDVMTGAGNPRVIAATISVKP
jgi:hypothetical protein